MVDVMSLYHCLRDEEEYNNEYYYLFFYKKFIYNNMKLRSGVKIMFSGMRNILI